MSRAPQIAPAGQLPAAKRLRHLRERAGYSMDELAKAMGYAGQSSIQRYESDDSIGALKFEFIEKLRPHLVGRGNPPILDEEISLLGGLRARLAGVKLPPELHAHYRSIEGADRAERAQRQAFQETLRSPSNLIPLYAQISGFSDDGFAISGEEPPQPIEAPPQLARVPGAYALYMLHSTMEPRYYKGETLFIHPRVPVDVGDFVIASIKLPSSPAGTFVRQIASHNGDKYELLQINPRKSIRVRAEDAKLEKIVFSGRL